VSGQTSLPARFTLGIHWVGGWVDSRAGLVAVAKRKKSLTLPGIEPRSSSHYWLCYPGPFFTTSGTE